MPLPCPSYEKPFQLGFKECVDTPGAVDPACSTINFQGTQQPPVLNHTNVDLVFAAPYHYHYLQVRRHVPLHLDC